MWGGRGRGVGGGERWEGELEYWREQLKEAPQSLELPTDHPRPAVQSPRGGAVKLIFNRELLDALKQLSRSEGVTLFMSLLAGFQLLLCRYSGQEDVVVGTPVANRNRLEIEGLIGFFVNTLALRTRMRGNPSFRGLVQRVEA